MLKVPAHFAIAFACAAAITLAVSTFLVRFVVDEIRSSESTRRVNGDIVILAYAPSFPDSQKIRDAVARRKDVARAGIFALQPVQVESPVGRAPALLKLQTFDENLISQLRLSAHEVPRPSVGKQQPVELVVGELLARRLGLVAGDSFWVHVTREKDSSTTASIRCSARSITDWGLDYHSNQLTYGELRDSGQFGLPPIGIELLVKQSALRTTIARDLQADVGSRFKVMSLEDVQAAKAASSGAP